jgi:DNA-binding NarL/FixJ family response regulator
MTANVLIVDAHELIRMGLRKAFEQTIDLHVVAEAKTMDEAYAMERAHRPDVVVVDMDLDNGRGIHFVRSVRSTRPDVGVLALTTHHDDLHLFSALEAGASAFASTWAPCHELVTAVRAAGSAPGAFTASDLAGAMRRKGQATVLQLTTREDDVLQLLSEGLSVAQVSAQLFISPSTAKTHMAKIYDKLGASNRTQAVMSAVRLGLVTPRAAAS